MEIIPHKDIGAGEWDAFCSACPKAWLRHTIHGRRVAQALHPHNEDLSFGVMEKGKVVAVAPLITQPMDDKREFAYSINTRPSDTHSLPTPAPAASSKQAFALCIEEIDRQAKKQGIVRTRIGIDPLGDVPARNPMLVFGYTDASTTTSVVDLLQDEQTLLSRMAKGHRLDIAFAERQEYRVVISDEEGAWKDFLCLHPRMQKRQGLLALLYAGQRCAAGALAVAYKRGAYYAMSAMKEAPRGAGQLLQWRIMQELKRRGLERYDMGWQSGSTPKEAAIASFKRHFGGDRVPLWIGVKIY